MTSEQDIPPLSSLDFIPYINADGHLPEQFQAKVGVFAVFNQEQVLECIGYSRDIVLSLQQLLVRQPQHCYWLKVQTIDRPDRKTLEAIREAWIAENGSTPSGNGEARERWEQPIDVKILMTPEEQADYASAIDEVTQVKLLKAIARRVEAEILTQLEARGFGMSIRFNPKLKESGLLDLK
jgi:hypothetical protein